MAETVLVFALDAAGRRPVSIALPPGCRAVLWRPGAFRWRPPGPLSAKFLVWWLFHWLRVFANRDYAVLVIQNGDAAAHRSCVFPRYFRFPFMAPGDLQVGDTWTAPGQRGRGLATVGLTKAVELTARSGRVFWYLTEQSNVASVRVAEKAGFTRRADAVRTRRFGLRLFGAFVTNGPGAAETRGREGAGA